MEIRAVICDLDGTLIDLESSGSYVEKFAAIKRELLRQMTGRDFSRWEKKHLYPAIGLPFEESVRYMRDVFGLESDPSEYWSELERRDLQARKSCIGREITAFEDATSLLRLLKVTGTPTGIITNTPLSITRLELDRLGLLAYVNEIRAFTYNEPRSKPSPWGIDDMLDSFGVEPEGAWIFGDSGQDIEAARGAGCRSGQLLRDGRIRYDGPEPDVTGKDLRELWQKARGFMKEGA